jgi:hypothetical protein
MSKLVEGQTLWFVGASGGRFKGVREAIVITAVGRKWAQVKGAFTGRIDVDSLAPESHGYSPAGRCYLSQQDWMETEGCNLAWRNLRAAMPMSCPAGLSYDGIQHAAQLLGIDASEPGAKPSPDARLAPAMAAAPAQQFRYAMHALRAIADGVIQPGRYAELAIRHIAGDAAEPPVATLPEGVSATPRSDRLEQTRKDTEQARTPAYGDALALCRSLEAENTRLKAALAAQTESTPA